MRKFWIIYKSTDVIEGTVNCSEEEFVKNFITPNEKNIHSFHIFVATEVLTEEKITELL